VFNVYSDFGRGRSAIRASQSAAKILTTAITGGKKQSDEGASLFAVRVDGVVMLSFVFIPQI
jgi:hypothetical protein